MDQIVDLMIDEAVSPQLERDVHYGPGDEVKSGFSARIHNRPIGFRMRDLQIEAGATISGRLLKFYDAYELWIVPHRVSIMRRQGQSEPTAVGIEVEYLPAKRTFSIVGLVPSFEYKVHSDISGTFGGRASGTFGGVFTGDGNLEPMSPADAPKGALKDLGNIQVGATADLKLWLGFKTTVATTKIAAVGIGSNECEWRIDRDVEPLYGHDIETWAIVALPTTTTLSEQIDYNIRFYFNARTFLFNTRRQSEWKKVTCLLEKVLTSQEKAVWEMLEKQGPMDSASLLMGFPGSDDEMKSTIGLMATRRLVRPFPGGKYMIA